MNRISAATYLEVSIVIDSARDPLVSRRLDEIMAAGRFVIEPVTETQPGLRATPTGTSERAAGTLLV